MRNDVSSVKQKQPVGIELKGSTCDMYAFTAAVKSLVGICYCLQLLLCEKEGGRMDEAELPFHILQQRFEIRVFQWLLTMIYATDEINNWPNLLPNITLGYAIYTSCSVEVRALQGIMWQLSGKEEPVPNYRCQSKSSSSVIIGDSLSVTSVPMARILGLYHFPQISYGASVPTLSDKIQFPSFFRTTPHQLFQSSGLAEMTAHFGWTWIGILLLDNDFGQLGSQSLITEIEKSGACIAFSEKLPVHYSEAKFLHLTEVIKKSLANVIIIISTETSIISLMKQVSKENMTGKVWIAYHSWSDSLTILRKEFVGTLSGTIGFALHGGEILGFKEFLYSLHPDIYPNNLLIKPFWEEAFGCKWIDMNTSSEVSRLCTGAEKLEELHIPFFDVKIVRVAYCVYTAVHAAAYALHNLLTCKPGEQPFANRTCSKIHEFQPWQLFHYMKKVRFQMKTGEKIYFDENGDIPPMFDNVNWQPTTDGSIAFVNVGIYNNSAPAGQRLSLNQSSILWNGGHRETPHSVCSNSCLPGYRKAARRGEPVCCFDCTPCSEGEISNKTDSIVCIRCTRDCWPNERQDACVLKPIEFLSYEEPLGISLAAISILCSFLSTSVLGIFFKYRDSPIVKANNYILSYLLLSALVLCFLCSLVFIGHPIRVTCMLRQVTFGISFVLCISCVLSKTITVVIAFKATKPNSKLKKWVGIKLPISIVCASSLIQVVICFFWLMTSPPFPYINYESKHTLIIECIEGSVTAFWCMLGYMSLLASVSFIVAFLARKLPDSFNEAKFITFSMLVFVSVWLSFIPAYLSTQGKYMVAVEIFAILSSSTGLLTCIFFPKCYIILIRPEMNTREYLMNKGSKGEKTL
ncbi:extracellular calcium-sensing receptor-like [Protopterus annectens]|uniref:extracellular calcium-sensing receptor-like n=1 Tax=Protopterus annectens TaxID=7888 RepID=UPI001CF954C6|nr:extracellular calcium-sensing receptor-like [Protopterus annectens]